MRLRRRPKNLISQTQIESQSLWGQLQIILRKRGDIRVSFVPAKNTASRHAFGHIAQSLRAAVLGGALAEKEIVECTYIQQSGGFLRCVDVHLMSFPFSPKTHILPASGVCNRVLPHV